MDIGDYKSDFPEFNAMEILQKRLAQKASDASAQSDTPKGPFDPYEMMVQKKRVNAGEILDDVPVQSWPEEDIAKLEEFCGKMGIVGFNCGRMSPAAALAMLKQKLGVVDEIPRTEGYGPNYPYTQAMQKRILLKG